jgi:hypothetical protein
MIMIDAPAGMESSHSKITGEPGNTYKGAIWLPCDLGRDLGRETYRRKQFLLRLVRRGVRGEPRGRLVATLGGPMILEVPDGKSPWAKPQLASPHRLEA